MDTTATCVSQPLLQPQVYVACLASYNSGILHGEWISADQELDEIIEEINQMLDCSPLGSEAMEWVIHDYDNFYQISLGEYESLEKISKLGRLVAKYGEPFCVYTSFKGTRFTTEEGFISSYVGEYESEAGFSEELYRDCYEIPDFLDSYIDWGKSSKNLVYRRLLF